jgi:hypothetical protein
MPHVPENQWRAVTAATLNSRRADCGHRISPASNALVWLRVERAGAHNEVYSVCFDCHVEGQDYEYRAGSDKSPTRTREETL